MNGRTSRPMPCVRPDETGDLPRFRHLRERRVEAGAGPAVLFELAIDVAGDVEAPHRARLREAEALERDRELGDPALGGAARAHVPDRVPLGVQLAVRDQAVDQRAGRIGGEVEGAALIAEGVEQDLDAIVGAEHGVAGHLRAEDARRLVVEGEDADVEPIAVGEQRDGGALARRGAFGRLALHQLADRRRRAPGRLVEHAVDRDRLGDRRHRRGSRPRHGPLRPPCAADAGRAATIVRMARMTPAETGARWRRRRRRPAGRPISKPSAV